MNNVSALITLIVYSLALVAISLWVSRRAKSEASYILGERDLGAWVAGLAYAASSSSAWVLLGFSGFVYAVGVSALWMVPGILAGYAAVWFWAGPVLQAASRGKGHLTLTDFLTEDASPGTKRAIRILASAMIVFCFCYYIASQFQGAGIAFDVIFGSGLTTGVLIGAVVILLYTFLGGFLAVSLIDTIQGLLIGLVAVLLPVLAFFKAGGMAGMASAADAFPQGFLVPFGTMSGWMAAGFVLGLTATGFGALGQPHLVTWIMAARDRKTISRGGAVAIGWAAIVYAGMAVLGLSSRVLFGAEAPAEGVFFEVASIALPPALAGIILAATLSAIMSTVDSQLLVAGAAMSHDLGLRRLFGERDVLASRLAVTLVAVVAILFTLNLPATIFERTLFAWTALGASFGPIVVVRTLGIRPAGGAILASLVAAFALSVAYEFILPGGPGNVWARTLPWLLSFLCLLAPFARRKPAVSDAP